MAGVAWPLIAAHRERLLRIARRRCPTREDAEDVVSEAMLRAATFDDLDERRLEQFLTSVTVRLCADLHRRSDRGSRAVVRLLPDLDETAPSPEDEVCHAVEAEVLNELVATLPVRQRAVLVDRAHGLSLTQIARRHALTYKAAESALSRARGAMRAALGSALGTVAAVFGVLRPRRVTAVTALPVATLVMVGAVVRLPIADDPGDRLTRVPYRATEAAGDAEPGHGLGAARREPATPLPAAHSRRTAVAGRVPLGGSAPPAPPKELLRVGQPGGPYQLVVTEQPQEDENLPDHLSRCMREGGYVHVRIEPSNQPVRNDARCGRSIDD